MDMSDLLYRNHNIAVMLAVKFAAQLGLEVGIGEDPLGLGWPVLYIVLPTGEQVSWRVPPEELVGNWPEFKAHHDGHTPDERSARVLHFLKQDPCPEPSPEARVVDGAPAIEPPATWLAWLSKQARSALPSPR